MNAPEKPAAISSLYDVFLVNAGQFRPFATLDRCLLKVKRCYVVDDLPVAAWVEFEFPYSVPPKTANWSPCGHATEWYAFNFPGLANENPSRESVYDNP